MRPVPSKLGSNPNQSSIFVDECSTAPSEGNIPKNPSSIMADIAG
jgi:hypothetical protein